MSKAFTREDDAPDDVLVVRDSSLPPGEKNYVTPEGASRLRAAIERLRAEPRTEPRRKQALEQELAMLLSRLDVTEVVYPAAQPKDRVLFGATVTVRDEAGVTRIYRIVGVDEADAKRGWVSWRSPIARCLTNQRVGDRVTVRTPSGAEELEIVAIA